MISTLIYSSTSCLVGDAFQFDREMEKIRHVAAQRNEEHGITGFLFYFDNRFVQILEGEFEAVTHIYSRIRHDERHKGARIIWFSEIEGRDFSKWSMECSMNFIERNHSELSVKLKFINRFISDTSQQPIMLRDLLVSVALEMQRRQDFPKLQLVPLAANRNTSR